MDLINQFKLWIHDFIELSSPYAKQAWSLLNDYAYLRAGILIIISFFLAKLLSRHIPFLIIKLTQRVKFSLGEDIANLTPSPIFQALFLISLGIIASLSELSEAKYFIILASIKSLLIVILLVFIYRIIRLFLEYLCNKESDDNEARIIQSATLPLFENIIILLLALAGIHQVFGVWNIDMTALLASAGIVGLAVGMASKDTLSDVIAGILILTDAPYHVGDVIQVGTEVGTITSIGIRSTRIVTKDNIGITVPNGKMGASTVVNESSAEDTSLRIKLPINVAFGVIPETIREIVTDIAKNTKNIMKDKKITVILSDFQQQQLTLTLLCWIPEPKLKSSILSELREKIYLAFLEHKIPISLPEERAVAITEQADAIQQVEITSIPTLQQSLVVKEIPELIQSISIKDLPEVLQSVSIKELPELLQSISIKDMPEVKQSVAITEMPDRNGTLSIKEIPDLFGSGSAKNIPKPYSSNNTTKTAEED